LPVRIGLIGLSLLVVPVVMALSVAVYAYRTTVDETTARLAAIAPLLAQQATEVLSGTADLLAAIDRTAVADADLATHPLLASGASPLVALAAIASDGGTVAAVGIAAPALVELSRIRAFGAFRQGRAAPVVDAAADPHWFGREALVVALRRGSSADPFRGMLLAGVDAGVLRRFWEPVGAVGVAAVGLVDASGTPILLSGDGPSEAVLRAAIAGAAPADPSAPVLQGGNPLAGSAWLAVRHRIDGFDVDLVAVADWPAVRDRWWQDLVWTMGLAVPATGALILIAMLALRRAAQAQSSAQSVQAEMARRETAEARLRQTQKMEALGLLTGGVAHDFNNLLTAIQGNLRFLLREAPPEMIERLESIGLAVERGEQLSRQLLTFARPQPTQRTLLDVNDVVRQIMPLVERTVSAAVDVRIALTTMPCPIEVDRAVLELSILNLVANGRDAMPDGGTLTILTERVPRGLDGNPLVLLSVRDTGVGMPASIQERVFEPFFTTKEVGKGTGLGLSAVYGFVRQAGGSVQIESAPGFGTTVNLLLPESARRDPVATYPTTVQGAAAQAAAAAQGAAVQMVRARGLVLVVEDDALVRMVTVDGLREAGLEVIVAEDAPEALRVLEETGASLDAVVTDVVMPRGMSGIDLARVVRRRWPELALVVTTGYSATDIQTDELPVRHGILMKPFSIEELVDLLAHLIADDAANPQLALW
jgi:signal transduction histidine kinase/CheY-like chemotaxis protein